MAVLDALPSESKGPPRRPPKSSADKALGADGRSPAEIRSLAVDHFDPVDGAISTLQVKGVGAVAATDHTLNADIVGVAVPVDHLEIQDFHIIAARSQPDGLEASFRPTRMESRSRPRNDTC